MEKIYEEEFLRRFNQRKDRDEFQYNNDYAGWNKHIHLNHLKCGREWDVTPYSLCTKNSGCPYCYRENVGKNKRIDEQLVIEKFNQLSNGEYTLLEDYTGIEQRIKIRHNKCGLEYYTTLKNFINHGARCKCESGLIIITEKEAIHFLNQEYPDLELVGEFNGWSNINTFKCKKCGNIMHKTFAILKSKKQKYGCGKCYQKNKVGQNSPTWKGGDTEFIRAMRKLILPWKFESAKVYNNRCIITGKSGGNEVHHLNKNFMQILEETLMELNVNRKEKISDYSQEEYENICKTLQKKNYENGYGVVINKKLHREFHYQYGFKNNTFEQFQEYCKKFGVAIIMQDGTCKVVEK